MRRMTSVCTLLFSPITTPALAAELLTVEKVYVETGLDTDNDGNKDRIYVRIDRPTGATKSWSLMLARVFKIDVLRCDCGGDLIPLGAIQDLDEVRRYLKHVNMEYDPPPRGPPAHTQGSFDFQQHYHTEDIEPVVYAE